MIKVIITPNEAVIRVDWWRN